MRLLSDNFYWVSPENDFLLLERLDGTELRVTPKLHSKGNTYSLKLKIRNISNTLAFFVNLDLINGNNGNEILPVYWSNNYFSLLPGEERTVTSRWKNLNRVPFLIIEGWNLYPQIINLHTGKILKLKPEILKIETPKTVKDGEAFTLCFTAKNSSKLSHGITSFPIWIEYKGDTMLTHAGLKGQEKKRICIALNYNGH